ncbi:unnamed protein product, partial [Ascophyllum nodosum]
MLNAARMTSPSLDLCYAGAGRRTTISFRTTTLFNEPSVKQAIVG